MICNGATLLKSLCSMCLIIYEVDTCIKPRARPGVLRRWVASQVILCANYTGESEASKMSDLLSYLYLYRNPA